jgi:hypothetical protein
MNKLTNEEDLRAAAVEPKDPPLQGQVEHQNFTPGSSSSSPLLLRLIRLILCEHGAGRPEGRHGNGTRGSWTRSTR